MPTHVLIIANWAQGGDFSGGDRIFIELARRWMSRPGFAVHLYLSEEGWQFCQKKNLTDVPHSIWSPAAWTRFGQPINFFLRTIHGMWRAAYLEIPADNTFVYSASDFWPDCLPAWVLKVRSKRVRWVAGFYLFAPRPWSSESPYRGFAAVKGWMYWLTQSLTFFLVRRFADKIFSIVELDKQRFMDAGVPEDRIAIVRGGVDVELSESIPEPAVKKYDAVFIGRFHPQKGGLELVDIWAEVNKRRPGAKLCMIGDNGSLRRMIEARIAALALGDVIDVKVGLNDAEKIAVYKSGRVVVHPAVYDVGGMAACEAMVCGLPGVSFDLPGLRTYYPKGMLKAPERDIQGFAACILQLLENEDLHASTRADALDLAYSWDWRKRADDLLAEMVGV